MKVANIFLKKKANKDSFDVGREGKCENCKYFLEKKQNKKTKTLTMLVERISWKLQKKWEKNKDFFDVGRERKCENCKYFLRKTKQNKKNKDSYDVGREDK